MEVMLAITITLHIRPLWRDNLCLPSEELDERT